MGQVICRSESLSGCSKPSRILRPFVNSFLRERYQKLLMADLFSLYPLDQYEHHTAKGFCSHAKER